MKTIPMIAYKGLYTRLINNFVTHASAINNILYGTVFQPIYSGRLKNMDTGKKCRRSVFIQSNITVDIKTFFLSGGQFVYPKV